MTLIASYITKGIPIILGDLLVTIDQSDKTDSYSIPTIHNVNDKLEKFSSLRVIGLSQKVNLINNRICIAWAGSYIQAKTFIEHVHEHCCGLSVSNEDYNAIIDAYSPTDLSKVNMISYFYDGNGYFRRNLNTPMFELDGLTDVQVEGTGTPEFIQNIETVVGSGDMGGNFNPFGEVVSRALAFTSQAFCRQIVTGAGVLDGWGGGFEIVHPQKKIFSKVDKTLSLLWNVLESENGELEISSIPLFIKSSYQKERLRIFVCDWSQDSSGERLYVADPMFKIDKSIPIEIPDLEYEWLINYFQFEGKDSFIKSYCRVDRFGSESRPIKIISGNNKYTVKYDKKYIENVVSEIFNTK